MNYVSNCNSTRSAGVITLYDNSYVCIETYKDNASRLAIVVLAKDNEKLIVANVYAPCDSVLALAFMVSVYDKVYEIMDSHPDAFLIMGGDFNACMDAATDSLNETNPAVNLL